MTFPASLPWQKFSRNLNRISVATLLALLCSCAGTEDVDSYRKHQTPLSSQFEWGVQHYEAGDYPKAISTFEKLRKEGASVPEFDLLHFYLGMSHFRLAHFEPAAQELESFLQAGTIRQESQDARISLLQIYEKLGRWKNATSLATDTDKLTLFQNNRALLKLIWARALREQGELLGAKAVLADTLPYLDKFSPDESGQPFYADPDQDLWGRYHYTAVLVEEMECDRTSPKELGAAGKKKGKKTAIPKRLYPPWVESVSDCQRKALMHASEELFERDSPWGKLAEVELLRSIGAFSDRIQGYLKEESAVLDRHRALQKTARENFYRILGTVEEQIKNFKNQSLNTSSLESIRKQIDHLLMSISSPS